MTLCFLYAMNRRLFVAVICTILATQAIANEPNNSQSLPAINNYANPIMDIKAADPHVIKYEDIYYLYPTWGANGYHVFTSPDLVHWEHQGKCFNDPREGIWAPDVFHNKQGDNKFYLYYTVGPLRKKQIGVAVADSPLGPFEDRGILVDNAIDAHLFQDSTGECYLYYVELYAPPGNRIRVQAMADPLHKKGKSTLILSPEEPWECVHGCVAEGPWMLKHNDVYYLMYSGSSANCPDYAVGYATADSPVGPFTKYSGNPIVKRTETVLGPGHHCVVEGPHGNLWMVYHQKENTAINYKRFLAIDPLWFDDRDVVHANVSRGTEQPAP